MLTSVHRKKHRAFALQHKHWTLEQWEKVAFSDESCFLLHWINGCWRIRQETSENKLPETIVGHQHGGGGSVMVRGMFSWHDLDPLIPVEGTLNSCAYLSIVADNVNPDMATVYPANDGKFQQDNVMCPNLFVHGSRSMMKSSSYYPGFQIPQILTLAKICGNISIDTSDRKTLHLGIFTSYMMLCSSHGQRCLSPPSKHTLSRSIAVLAARGGYSGYYIGGHNNVTRLCIFYTYLYYTDTSYFTAVPVLYMNRVN
ncbi:hypothetical protein AVEN_12619-1 [Araneus ventricosus]|uniref:Uncharacterized protein n=1 Tax=Araneus ventricosus TaxID=182803 RepID=A0A4Y2ABI2_ARAVE|nr:hypothetical protein AVEN_12619-1 [Araneus ventricosus]